MDGPAVNTFSDRPWVGVLTAPNPGPKTLSGTNTYIVGRPHAYVIDPGPANKMYQRRLASWLFTTGIAVRGILLTHGHPDHAPGAATLKKLVSAPVWASSQMRSAERRAASVDEFYAEVQSFDVEGRALRVFAAPGHSADSVVLWLEDAGILFAGDTILGTGTTLIAPPEGNMARYMETLEMLRGMHPRLIAPGHGPLVEDPTAKVEEYLSHRRQRECQVLLALQAGPASISDLVARIYTEVDPALHGLAAASVAAQLQKLMEEGRVRRSDGLFSVRGESGWRGP